MTLREFSADEKVEEIESLLRAFNHVSRGVKSGVTATNRCVDVLKAIRADILGGLPEARGPALEALQRRIDHVLRTKGDAPPGYDPAAMVGLAQVVVGHWKTVKQALQRFGEDRQ